MGPDALWTSPDQIRRRFYEVIVSSLREHLGREVELVIEKEKYLAGPIYTSMYSEAWNADVYLADLTGANPNVYLELGVRWALSDGVTVLLAQDPTKLKFNVASARAEPYSSDPDALERAIDRVVKAVIDGLKAKERGDTDSPVRQGGLVRTITTAEYDALQAELRRLRAERGEEYLDAANRTHSLPDRIDLLRQAVAVNPLVAESHFQLGTALRQSGSDDQEAIDHLATATRLDPPRAAYWRELGIAHSKTGDAEAAVRALQQAVRLDPADFDALSTLGGAYRRIALRNAPDSVDWEQLRRSKQCYEQASERSPRDSYPLLNVARIELMLSRTDPPLRDSARSRFQRATPLCEFERQEALDVAKRPDATVNQRIEGAYKAFDYADTLLHSGRFDEARRAYEEAIAATPADTRRDVFRSVAAGLQGLTELDVLDPETAHVVQEVNASLQG